MSIRIVRLPHLARFVSLSRRFSSTPTDTSIEVEKKILLSAPCRSRILSHCTSSSTRVLRDTYWDTRDMRWARNDVWLRQRNASWELKYPAVAQADASRVSSRPHAVDEYVEYSNEGDIAAKLGLPVEAHSVPLAARLEVNHLTRFTTIVTTRTHVSLVIQMGTTGTPDAANVSVDLDHVTFEPTNDTYDIAEVEVVIPGEHTDEARREQVARAHQIINTFMTLYGVDPHARVHGKVLEFLRRHRPHTYAQLLAEGFIARKVG